MSAIVVLDPSFSLESLQVYLNGIPESTVTAQLLEQVLMGWVKPMFTANAHPLLSVATGRKLPRPAGGPLAAQDYYEGQRWKNHATVGSLVLWCVKHAQPEDYENLWYLLVPPVMTLLDDYEACYKLQGVHIVSEMLRHVPKDVLIRSGIDGLIRASLSTCLAHLQDQETPELIKHVVDAFIDLTTLTTTIGSSDRFDQLCAILGDSIIGGIWIYGYEKPDAILASLQVLPRLLRCLGIGCSRFLKALIMQILYSLALEFPNKLSDEMQLASLSALCIIIEECSPCMARWKTTILDGVGRCWVMHVESNMVNVELETGLRRACQLLADACPSVVEKEYVQMAEADGGIFGGLVGDLTDRKG